MAPASDWKEAHRDFCRLFDRHLNEVLSILEPAWLASLDAEAAWNPDEEVMDLADQAAMGEAYRYASFGGKRVRPFLMALAYGLMGQGSYEASYFLNLATALELIHSYSLVHDDLPAMDNDAFRRGQPSLHAKFGEDRAILVGDGLLNLSMECGLKAIAQAPSPKKESLLQALTYLYLMSGLQGMVGGQALDLRPDLIEEAAWLKIMVEKKTCALFMAACRMGVILAGGDPDHQEAASQFGYHLGMAYQMKDDIFDEEEDRSQNKRTLADDLGREGLTKALEDETDKALTLLDRFDHPDLMKDFALALVKREK